MRDENEVLLKIFIKISVISLFCFIAYLYAETRNIFLMLLWILAYVFALEVVSGVRSYLRLRRERDASSRFQGCACRVTLGVVIIWAVGVFIVGIYVISDKTFNPIVLSAHIGLVLFFLVGFGWLRMMQRLKDRFLFFSRYLVAITLVSLLLLLTTPATVPGRTVRLFELLLAYPSNYLVVYIHTSTTMILITLYSTKAGRSRRGARVTGILVLVNIILYSYIIGWKLNGIDPLGISHVAISYMFHLASGIPQFLWAAHFGKLRMTIGVGWE